AEELVARHSGKAALKKCAGSLIVGCNAGEVEVRGHFLLKLTKHIVATAQNGESTSGARVQSKAAEVTNHLRFSIYIARPDCARPTASRAPPVAAYDGLLVLRWGCGFGKKVGSTFK